MKRRDNDARKKEWQQQWKQLSREFIFSASELRRQRSMFSFCLVILQCLPQKVTIQPMLMSFPTVIHPIRTYRQHNSISKCSV